MEQFMWIVWLVLLVLMILVEAMGPALVSIWFAVGALAALIVSFIPGVAWWIEVIIFIVISTITLLAVRPISKRYFKRNVIKSNVDSLVGKRGVLQKEVSPFNAGLCKINDVVWTAVSGNDKDTISEGSIVEVVAIAGNKLIIKKVEDK